MGALTHYCLLLTDRTPTHYHSSRHHLLSDRSPPFSQIGGFVTTPFRRDSGHLPTSTKGLTMKQSLIQRARLKNLSASPLLRLSRDGSPDMVRRMQGGAPRIRRRNRWLRERKRLLEKMRLAMGSTPKKQEVLIQTSTGFFRFQGISEKFTRRLYEWEKARGIGPEASTFALLTPGYKASLVGHHTAFTGDRDISDGAILPRCKSASSVSNMITTNISHHQSSLSLNDVGVLEHVGAVAAALEESRAVSEPHLRSNASDEEPGAVIVDVEDVEEETAAPLLVAHEVQGHMPVYCYAPSEVTRLIDSSGSESDKDTSRMAQRRDSVRTESSYKLIEENISLINKLRLKEDICRKLENEIEDLEGEIDNVAKTHKEELEKLRIEESDLQMQDEDLEAGLSQEQLVKKLRNRIEELEQWQERLEREGDTLQVVMSSVVWRSPSGGLTGLHVDQLGSPWVYNSSIVRVVPKNGMTTSFVVAGNLLSTGTVLPNPAGNSLPGPSQDRINDKRQKWVRPSSPLQLKIQEVMRPQPRFLVMSRVEEGETLKCASPFILERVINGAAKSEVSIRKLRDSTAMIQTINDVQMVNLMGITEIPLSNSAHLQNSFVQHSEQQAALAQNLVGKMKLLQEANTNMASCEETTGIQEYQSDTQEASLWLSDQEDVVAIAQDLSTQLLSLAEKLQVALTERNKELTSLRFQLRGHRRKQLPKFRCGHYWFSEEGMSASLGSLNNEIDEVSVLPRKNSQDLAQFPALLTYKVLELKRGLNYLHALSSSPSDGGVRHHETRAQYCIDKQELVTDEEPSASFVLRVRNKIEDETPDKFIENDDNVANNFVQIHSEGEIDDLDVQKRDMTIDSLNDSQEEIGIYNRTERDSAKKSKYNVTSKGIETSKESVELIQSKPNESKVTAISQFETEVLAAKEMNGKLGKQKRLLRTRRVSDTNMGCRYKEAPGQSNVISRSRIKKKKETVNTEFPRQNSCDSEDNHKTQFSTSPDDKQSKNVCNLVSLDGIYLKEKLDLFNSQENVHYEERQNLTQVDEQTVVTPIVRSKTTFLVGTCNTANDDPPVASSSVNVFVPTTRKIFSPVRRDSKGKASSVISYVVEEPSIGEGATEHEHSSGTQLSLQQTQATNGIQNSSSEINNYKLGIDNSSPDKSESSNIIPPSWALRRNRSHSSSPCFQRRQLISSERKDKIISSKEDSISSDTSKCFAGSSRPSISNSQNSFLNDLTNSNGKLDSQRQSQSGKLEKSCSFQASPLPQSPNPNRRELNRIASKEAAPSIRMMIAKYNQKLNEQDLTGGRSPEISGSGSGSPVAWRSPVAERRVKVQTEKYQQEVRRVLEQGGKKRTREVQKSASAGVIRLPEKVIPEQVRGSFMKSEIAREENLNKPPLVVVLPKGILKSSSAGTIKSSLPLQFKVSVPNENKIPENSTVRNSIVPPPERFKDAPQNIEKSINSKPPSPRLNFNTNTSSPFPTEHVTNDKSTPFPRLRALKIKQAKEDFLSKGPGSQSWTSEVETPSVSTSPEPSLWGSISRGVSIEERTSSGAQSRLSQVSMGSESSYESSNIVQGRSNGEDGLILTKSVSAGMINLEPSAYRRLSSEPGVDGGQVSDGGTSPTSSKLRFGISSITSKFRKVKMRKNKGRDTPKMNTVSMLCRQSLLIDLPISGGALSKGTPEDQRPCSSKSCPSSPVLQRSTSRTIMEEGIKTSSSWIRNPAKRIFKLK
uniref:Uncharacterized protein n=1 Tax=Timema bartmani TaxID=61472 RepID=A0A7R9F5C2_9NEOP|nr:unnamed protein product [Timema bartmani]